MVSSTASGRQASTPAARPQTSVPTSTSTRPAAPAAPAARSTSSAPRRRRPQGTSSRPQAGRSSKPRSKPAFTTTGEFSAHVRGFGFVRLHTPHTHRNHTIDSVFVNPNLAARLLAGDIVEVGASVSGDRASALTVKVLTRPRTVVFGRVSAGAGTSRVLTVDTHCSQGTFDLAPSDPTQTGHWALARVAGTPNAATLGRVTATIATFDTMTPAAVRAMMFARFGVEQGRNDDVDNAARQAAELGRAKLHAPAEPGRVDFTDETTFTVDGPSTRDLDDAISASEVTDGVRVRVHIADVADLVTPGSVLDADAYTYATSIYLPSWNRPMLPPQLSEDVLSLLPAQTRNTLSVSYTVTAAGDVTDIDVTRSRITSDARLTYTQATDLLCDDTDVDAVPATVLTALRTAHTASLMLGRARSARLVLGERTRPEATWTPGVTAGEQQDANSDAYENATFTIADASTSTLADEMIERLMVAANEAVASWLVERNLPGVFRVHEAPSADLGADVEALLPHLPRSVRTKLNVAGDGVDVLASLAEEMETHEVTDRLVDALLMRHLGRATYTADQGTHYGLGSTGYVHFTSPIRRYADLLVHRVIAAHLDADAPLVLQLTEQMDAAAAHLTHASWTAARIESGFRRFATETLFEQFRTSKVAGVVTGFAATGAFVSAPDHGLSGVLPFTALDGTWAADARKVAAVDAESGRTLTLGARVWVQAVDVVPGTDGVTWCRVARPARRRSGR